MSEETREETGLQSDSSDEPKVDAKVDVNDEPTHVYRRVRVPHAEDCICERCESKRTKAKTEEYMRRAVEMGEKIISKSSEAQAFTPPQIPPPTPEEMERAIERQRERIDLEKLVELRNLAHHVLMRRYASAMAAGGGSNVDHVLDYSAAAVELDNHLDDEFPQTSSRAMAERQINEIADRTASYSSGFVPVHPIFRP